MIAKKISILVGLFLLISCDNKSLQPKSGPQTVDRLQGTWQEVQSVCGSETFTSTGITNRIVFSGAQYTITNTTSACTATRTGTFSAGEPSSLSLSYASLSCATTDCKLTFRINSDTKNTECKTQISTDGQNFAFSADDTTLYMTPQNGPDSNCYYKYTRQ